MERRRLIAACGTAVAALAGCLDRSPGAGSGPGRNGTSPNGTAPSTANGTGDGGTSDDSDPALSASLDRLQPAAVVMTAPDSIGVDGEGHQYLYLTVDASDAPPREDLAFRFDGTTRAPFEDPGRGLWRGYHHGDDRYDAERGTGWLLFELPGSGDAGDAALLRDGTEAWRPGERLRVRLAAPAPELSLSWSVPETVAPGATPTVEFAVTNEGERDTRFVAGLNRTGPRVAYAPIEGMSHPVPAGETARWTVTDGLDVRAGDDAGDGEADLTYRLSWTGGRREASVRVTEDGS